MDAKTKRRRLVGALWAAKEEALAKRFASAVAAEVSALEQRGTGGGVGHGGALPTPSTARGSGSGGRSGSFSSSSSSPRKKVTGRGSLAREPSKWNKFDAATQEVSEAERARAARAKRYDDARASRRGVGQLKRAKAAALAQVT